jgi:hypothetical protein
VCVLAIVTGCVRGVLELTVTKALRDVTVSAHVQFGQEGRDKMKLDSLECTTST